MKKINIPEKIKPESIVWVGIPYDENSSFARGCAQAPMVIRKTMWNGSSNLYSEMGENLEDQDRFNDCGDIDAVKGEKAISQIEENIDLLLERNLRIISLGGDHSITCPIIRAFSKKYKKLTILHFDAHSDTYQEFEGNRYSHASPFARIMEEFPSIRLVQVGIRTLNAHQREQIKRFDIDVMEAPNFDPRQDLKLEGPVYLSLDLDVLDPAFAPGVSHHEPGGLSVRDVITMIQRIEVPIVGADIVEYNPTRDFSDMTAMVCVKFLKEIAAKMVQ